MNRPMPTAPALLRLGLLCLGLLWLGFLCLGLFARPAAAAPEPKGGINGLLDSVKPSGDQFLQP
ncbi:MAG TPA: hypothetical protein VH111_11910, partial [Steroidobacteraceae bacterium]|nr:hypothetical protein [Steroidobacteraceae bacterium]